MYMTPVVGHRVRPVGKGQKKDGKNGKDLGNLGEEGKENIRYVSIRG